MLWPENKTLVQLGGYGEAGANPARFRHRDAPARQSGLCAVLPPGAQSGYRAQLAYNAHGAMGCVQKSAAWHRAPPRAVRRRFVPPFRFQPGRQGNICPPFRSVQTKPPTAAVRPATGAFFVPCAASRAGPPGAAQEICAQRPPFFAGRFSKAPAAMGGPAAWGAFCAAPALAKGCFVLQKTPRHMLLAGAAKKRGRSVT